jgi:hypothetical protein
MTKLVAGSVTIVPIPDATTKVELNAVGFMGAMFVWLAVLVWLVYWVG